MMRRPFRLFRRGQERPNGDRAVRTPAQMQEALRHIEDARRCAEAGDLRDRTDWSRTRLEVERRANAGR